MRFLRQIVTAGGAAMLALGVAACDSAPLLPSSTQERDVPYWASINRARAIMRRGPSEEMPAMWEYRRNGLPIKIVGVRGDWRQVQDSEGTVGWMHKRLLTGARSLLVTAPEATLHRSADGESGVVYRAQRGVVGRLGDCRNGFCELDVDGRRGWISADAVWGEGAAR